MTSLVKRSKIEAYSPSLAKYTPTNEIIIDFTLDYFSLRKKTQSLRRKDMVDCHSEAALLSLIN